MDDLLNGKKYSIIYADPAWTFKTYSKKGKEKKSAENHYSCMTIEDIHNLPINEIADDNCVLFIRRSVKPIHRFSVDGM